MQKPTNEKGDNFTEFLCLFAPQRKRPHLTIPGLPLTRRRNSFVSLDSSDVTGGYSTL